MNIQFYNHACFSVENDDALLLCDPYLSGTAFNNGWDLIVNDVAFDRFAEKKLYIYYSHEHPDHFAIPFLKSIRSQDRNDVTVLFQKTLDERVKSFVSEEGFSVITLADQEKLELSDEFSITIGKVPFYDSWALIELDGKKILNANDCTIDTPSRVKRVKRLTDAVDILFTQFSYANWAPGGVADRRSRAMLAKSKLESLKSQADLLTPTTIVPFASMIRFCHVENFYMNDEVNTPGQVVKFIEQNTDAAPFLMEPYENWDGSSTKDNNSAIQYWENAYKVALTRDLVPQMKSFSFAELKLVCDEMRLRVNDRNSSFLIRLFEKMRFLPSQTIRISDLDICVGFSWRSGLKVETAVPRQQCIEMTSESLHFLFRFDFGVDTLYVNARFNGSAAQGKSLIRTFSPLLLNNSGRSISVTGLLSMLTEPSFVKQGLGTTRIARQCFTT